MNLWVKRTGQLASLAVALFFLSCQDDITLQGFQNPNPKFKLNYKEIPLGSSVYLIDSIISSSTRLMVGKYTDPAFGQVKSVGYFEPLRPAAITGTDSTRTIVYDSVFMDLRFDFYSYGGSNTSDQTFHIHELTSQIATDEDERFRGLFYVKKNDVTYNPTPTASATFSVNGQDFKTQLDKANADKDTTMLKIRLGDDIGDKLESLLDNGGVTMKSQNEFAKVFKGFSIVPDESNDKVVGFDIANQLDAGSTLSQIRFYYHFLDDTVRRVATLPLNYLTYSNIVPTRIGDLAALADGDFYQAIEPPTNRYIQTGTGVTTRVDFQNFYNFADTVGEMIINSAELAITEYETPGSYYPINSMNLLLNDSTSLKYRRARSLLRVTYYDKEGDGLKNDTLRVDAYTHPWDAAIVASYGARLNFMNELFTPVDDAGGVFSESRDGTKFGGHMTLLLQHIYERDPNDRFRYFSFLPADPVNGRSLNRLVFNKDNLRLKIYYTVPTVQQ
jgi:hypothetical protein